MLTTNDLYNGADYSASRWPVIANLEGIRKYVYIDTNHYATIGVGFLVSANVRTIIGAIQPNLTRTLSSAGYANLISAIHGATLNANNTERAFSSDLAAQNAIQEAVNNVLQNPNNYRLT